jgi:plasmid stabilization system protein ParE
MPKAVWTPEAEKDLAEIVYFIAVQDRRPLTARKNANEIKQKAEQYASTPEIGQRNDDLPEGSLYFRHKRWAIIYETRDYGIIVVRVVDMSRDFGRLFQ